MKQSLDTGVEVDNNEVKKNQRHTINKKPNMYKDINKDNQYFGILVIFIYIFIHIWLSLFISLYIFCLLCGVGSSSLRYDANTPFPFEN